jgi:hypothetical protein
MEEVVEAKPTVGEKADVGEEVAVSAHEEEIEDGGRAIEVVAMAVQASWPRRAILIGSMDIHAEAGTL